MKEVVHVGLINCNDIDIVQLELTESENSIFRIVLKYSNLDFEGQADNYFDALKLLRKELEKYNYQIVCKGACRNVYPSAMILCMGEGRKAYTLREGVPAKFDDLVDIFDFHEELECVSVADQESYYDYWFDSIVKE